MQINFEKTKERMSEIKMNAWARKRGHNPATLYRILDGSYPYFGGARYLGVIESLRKDGYLVEEPDAG
jgi:hypothetical protein